MDALEKNNQSGIICSYVLMFFCLKKILLICYSVFKHVLMSLNMCFCLQSCSFVKEVVDEVDLPGFLLRGGMGFKD